MKLLYKRLALALCLALAALPAAGAPRQDARLQIGSLDRFNDRAATVITVDVDETLLKLVPPFLGNKPDELKIKELIKALKGIYVRRFEFENEGEYEQADVDSIRSQLNAPWTRVAGVRSKKKANVDVFIMVEGENLIKGLAVLVAEPKALTVVNVVGPIDLQKLIELEGKFGIPKLGIETDQTKDNTKDN